MPKRSRCSAIRRGRSDAAESYTAGSKYRVVDAVTKTVVGELAPTAWNGGAVDEKSGDRAWRVDFSRLTTPGVYYVLDVDASVSSDLISHRGRRVPRGSPARLSHVFLPARRLRKKGRICRRRLGRCRKSRRRGPRQERATVRHDRRRHDRARSVRGLVRRRRLQPLHAVDRRLHRHVAPRLRRDARSAFGDDFGLPDPATARATCSTKCASGWRTWRACSADSGGCISVLGVASGSPPSSAPGRRACTVPRPPTPRSEPASPSRGRRGFQRNIDAAFPTELLGSRKESLGLGGAKPQRRVREQRTRSRPASSSPAPKRSDCTSLAWPSRCTAPTPTAARLTRPSSRPTTPPPASAC